MLSILNSITYNLCHTAAHAPLLPLLPNLPQWRVNPRGLLGAGLGRRGQRVRDERQDTLLDGPPVFGGERVKGQVLDEGGGGALSGAGAALSRRLQPVSGGGGCV